MQDHKDITIGESDYRIGRLKAADGSWIKTTFAKRYREYAQTQPAQVAPVQTEEVSQPVPLEVGFAMTAQFLLEQLSREEFAGVQSLCLSSCSRYSTKTGSPIPMPILLSDGRFAIPELEYDGPTTLELVVQTIAFNIAPYFPAAGSSGSTIPA